MSGGALIVWRDETMSVAGVVAVAGWTVALAAVSVGVAAMTDEKTFQPRAAGRGPWIAALGAGLGLVILGLALWLPAGGRPDRNSDLGSALLGGAVVGFAVLSLQWRFDLRARRRDEASARAQLRQGDRQHAQILTALRQDLPGIDFRGRDLSGFYLRGRSLKRARLDDAILDGADLSYTNLEAASLCGTRIEGSAYLEAAYLAGADLERARLASAYLRGAELTGAYLEGADLTGADLRETDLRQADLRGAVGLPAADLRDARYDAGTRWPGSGAPAPGTVRVTAADAWQSPARRTQAK